MNYNTDENTPIPHGSHEYYLQRSRDVLSQVIPNGNILIPLKIIQLWNFD